MTKMNQSAPSEVKTEDSRRGVEAVERALTLLDVFRSGETALTLKQLAEHSALDKATILRLSVSLERFGYLTREGDGTYNLGPTLWRLGSEFRRGLRLGPYIRPVLANLMAETGESASFYVQRDGSGVCLYRVNSPRLARDHIEEGEIIPLHLGSSGQVLDAYSTAKGKFRKQIKADGFYFSQGERDPDIGGISVPVFGPDSNLLGAVSLSGLLNRFDATRLPGLIEATGRAADEIMARLQAT